MTRQRLAIELMGEWPSTWDLQDNPNEALYGEGGKLWSDEREELIDELAGIDVVADTVAKLVKMAWTCLHCDRPIVLDENTQAWVDPEATGDDSVWRETCDAHDTMPAEHEPAPTKLVEGARWEFDLPLEGGAE